MIEHVKYGIPKQAMNFLVLRVIKMLSIVWLSIIPLGIHQSTLTSDRIVTGSFDKTAKLWDANSG